MHDKEPRQLFAEVQAAQANIERCQRKLDKALREHGLPLDGHVFDAARLNTKNSLDDALKLDQADTEH